MKHLPKHLRPRWRYLAVDLAAWPDADLDRGAFQRRVWHAARNLLGDAASADLDLTVVRFRLADGTGHAVVRTRRGEVDRARAALACIDAIEGHPVGVRVAGTSGTVRACEEKYIRPDPEVTERDIVFEDAERTVAVRGGRADVRVDSAFAGVTTLDFE